MSRIVCIPGVLGGKPHFPGMSIVAELIELEMIVGKTDAEIHEAYSGLPADFAQAAWQWNAVVSEVVDRDNIGREYLIDYTYAEFTEHGHASFAALVEGADGSPRIVLRPGTAPEWQARDRDAEIRRLQAEGDELLACWNERVRLATFNLSEADYAERWNAWVDDRPAIFITTGDWIADFGYAEPTRMRAVWDLSAAIGAAARAQSLSPEQISERTFVPIKIVNRALRGGRDLRLWDLMWIVARLGKRVTISIEDAETGEIFVDRGQY